MKTTISLQYFINSCNWLQMLKEKGPHMTCCFIEKNVTVQSCMCDVYRCRSGQIQTGRHWEMFSVHSLSLSISCFTFGASALRINLDANKHILQARFNILKSGNFRLICYLCIVLNSCY